jgi:hypothetical protein
VGKRYEKAASIPLHSSFATDADTILLLDVMIGLVVVMTRNGTEIVGFTENLLENNNKVLVATDNIHNERTAATSKIRIHTDFL